MNETDSLAGVVPGLAQERRDLYSQGLFTAGRDVDLAAWDRQCTADLTIDGILGESEDSLMHRMLGADWLQRMTTATVAMSRERTTDPQLDDHDARRLLEPIMPIIRSYEDRVGQQLADLNLGDPLDAAEVSLLSVPPWLQLVVMCSRTVVLEFHIWKDEQDSDTQDLTFSTYLETVQGDGALGLLRLYPSLTRSLVGELDRWQKRVTEFAARFSIDRGVLNRHFGRLGDLAGVNWSAGDPHNDGRRVAILEFAGGQKIVYKPRPVAVDEAFERLSHFVTENGPYPCRSAKVLARDLYGWTEYIEYSACSDTTEAATYYENQGALLALLHVLSANDMHYENVIASGIHPVCVDLETLIQPGPAGSASLDPNTAAPASDEYAEDMGFAMLRSVHSVGLLPNRILRADGDSVRSLEVGAMNGGIEQESLGALPIVVGLDSQDPKIVRQRGMIPESNNVPRSSSGAVFAAAEFLPEIVRGFRRNYDFLRTLEPHTVAAMFEGVRVRFVLRPTMVYSRLLAESWHPDLLQDGLERSHYFELVRSTSINTHGGSDDHLDVIVDREITQLFNNDVPLFTVAADRADLLDCAGEIVVENFFASSPVEAVTQKMSNLDEADRELQVWLIEASFAIAEETSAVDHGSSRKRKASSASDAGPVSEEQFQETLLEAIDGTATELLESAVFTRQHGTGWLTVNLVNEKNWMIGACSFDVFSGASGIAIFLANAGRLLNRPELTQVAVDYRNFLAGRTRQAIEEKSLDEDYSIGAYGDFGAAVLLDASLNAVLGRQEFTPGEELIDHVLGRISSDMQLDIISGSAGALLAAQMYSQQWSSPSLDRLSAAAFDRLLTTPTTVGGKSVWVAASVGATPLAGFSHGQSGISLALSRYAPLHAVPAVRALVSSAWEYEDSFYSEQAANWADLRQPGQSPSYMSAWCHGLPGILQARVESSRLLGMDSTPSVHHAIKSISAEPGRPRIPSLNNDSLCHGDLGNLIALNNAGLVSSSDPEYKAALYGAARRKIGRQPQSGVPLTVNVPGLMAGISGVGMAMVSHLEDRPILNVLDLSIQ
ncbi:type 2 lanthipeptide synthetase LanM [Paenarthrobacter nitroguajacolicus]|uniref:type 2 lanthipeptide synthetase LanM n=1 Tax=Paenarthrobacter nitroguajacolicus TaxID=211146 RepID=UPI0040546A2D